MCAAVVGRHSPWGSWVWKSAAAPVWMCELVRKKTKRRRTTESAPTHQTVKFFFLFLVLSSFYTVSDGPFLCFDGAMIEV